MYTLFLDDLRAATEGLPGSVVLCRNIAEAELSVDTFGVPTVISFDHDLGEVETGMQFLHWLIDQHLDGRIDLNGVQEVIVHSANPPGARNIQCLWNSFSNSELQNGVQAVLQPR